MKMITIKMNDKEEIRREEKILMALECLFIIAIRAVFVLSAFYYLFKINFTPEISSFIVCSFAGFISCAIPARKLIKC